MSEQQSVHDLYPPIMVRPVPFALPPTFLRQLGYERAVAELGPGPVHDDCQPRRFVALWWDRDVEHLGWSDGRRRGADQLDRHVWLAWLHGGRSLGQVGAWLLEHEISLDGDGSVLPPAGQRIGYWLIVDGAQNCAWVVIRGLARKVIRRQQLEPTDAELDESHELGKDPALARFYL